MKRNRITYTKRNSLLLLLIFFSAVAFAQNKESYNWYFGNHAGMTWNNTQTINDNGKILNNLPTPLTGCAMNQHEGSFTVSNTKGDLMFYSNGITIWNKNHTVMPNGSGMTGHNDAVQSGIVVPYPGQANKYIAFTIGSRSQVNTLAYSVIDMTLQNGLGDVVSGQKNINLTGYTSTVSENIATVKMTTEDGYWLITAGVGSPAKLHVWKVTSAGVQTACFKTFNLPANINPGSTEAYLRFSPDGKYFALPTFMSLQGLFFGEFNPATGDFTTLKRMPVTYNCYGVEFSASGELLYLSGYQHPNIYCYKFAELLSSSAPSSIVPYTINLSGQWALQLGPDGRIYSVEWNNTTMVVLDDVESYGNTTAHRLSGLMAGIGELGLPNFPSYYFASVNTTNCRGETATITASLEVPDTITNPIYKWYDALVGGTLIGTGPVFTTSTVLMNDTVFYVSVEGDNFCAGERLVVNITVGDCASLVPDTVTVIQNGQVLIDVKANDSIPNCPTVIPTPSTPLHGTAVTVGDKILYKPNTDYFGPDTLEYSVVCSGITYTTKIYITVFKAPTMIKEAILLPGNTVLNGSYPNPVSILFRDTINYSITASNTGLPGGETLIITDTVPPYLSFVTGSDNPSASTTTTTTFPAQTVLKWTFPSVPLNNTRIASFKATPQSGSVASQPLFINKAFVTIVRTPGDSTIVPTNGTFHQGGGISVTTFSAGYGGNIYNAEEQALDYMTTPRSGVIVVPNDGYRFTGWSHDDYVSLRGATIKGKRGIMHYDTLTIYGNVELTANFEIEKYPVRYRLNGGRNSNVNPSVYSIESGVIALQAPEKDGDMFIGWTGSNGDEPQLNVVIQSGSTGELLYYANFLESGRETDIIEEAVEDNFWAYGNELYVRTSKPGSVVRIFSVEGVLLHIQTIVTAGETKIRLTTGLYAVTLNNGIGRIVRIE